jgi:deazaflavin-dependent oxidoreductase (nitroreductase family)
MKIVRTPGWQQRHVDLYLKTNGREGHLVDFQLPGVPETPTLLLQTTGRKSGDTKIAPLIYGKDGNRFIIVASHGGAPKHPAWFLNLSDDSNVRFQVADKKYRGVARVVSGRRTRAPVPHDGEDLPALYRLPGENRARDSGRGSRAAR